MDKIDQVKKGKEMLGSQEYQLLVKDTQLFDRDYLFRCFRMSPVLFEELLCLVALHISKKKTKLRELITPSECISVTLRYPVTADTFETETERQWYEIADGFYKTWNFPNLVTFSFRISVFSISRKP